jgi:hypothetical protein
MGAALPRIGQLLAGAAMPLGQGNSTLGARARRQIDAGVAIVQDAPASGDIAYTHSVLCQVGLPRKQIDGHEFVRRTGNGAWLSVHSGYLDLGAGPVRQVVPYGPKPRVALARVITYAVLHKTREVPIGRSAREFMLMHGWGTNGGKRGALTSAQRQMHALAACRIQLGHDGRTFNDSPIEQFDAWNSGLGGSSRWPGVLVLSASFSAALQGSAVPLDNRALQTLGGSALALDIYCWLAHRLYRLDKPVMIPRERLHEQFGQEYRGRYALGNFWKTFTRELASALAVYQAARVDVTPDGLRLRPSNTPVPSRTLGRGMVVDGL